MGSTFFNFVAVNDADTKKKLDYRVYIGSGASTDFNMYRNKDYAYAVNFAHAGIPTDDNRVTYIDPIPASENNDNLVPLPTALWWSRVVPSVLIRLHTGSRGQT